LTGYWLSNYSSVQVLALLNALAVTCSASAAFTNVKEIVSRVNYFAKVFLGKDRLALYLRNIMELSVCFRQILMATLDYFGGEAKL
jgi:hypothetical protein